MPLGLQMTTVGALGATGVIEAGRGVVIEDYWWEIHGTAGAGHLTPIWDSAVIILSHDTWYAHPTTGAMGFYSPKSTSVVSDEGHWDVDDPFGLSWRSIKPLDV